MRGGEAEGGRRSKESAGGTSKEVAEQQAAEHDGPSPGFGFLDLHCMLGPNLTKVDALASLPGASSPRPPNSGMFRAGTVTRHSQRSARPHFASRG